MAKDVNRFTCTGRLVADPELRSVGASTITQWRLAVDTSYKKDDQWVNQAAFIDVSAWNGVGQAVGAACKKGDLVWMELALVQDNWEDKDGNKRQSLKFKLWNQFDWHKVEKAAPKQPTAAEALPDVPAASEGKKRGRPAKVEKPPENEDDDGDIPF